VCSATPCRSRAFARGTTAASPPPPRSLGPGP
jgi:hypothetical protein